MCSGEVLTVSSHAYVSQDELTQRNLSQSAQVPRNAPLSNSEIIEYLTPNEDKKTH